MYVIHRSFVSVVLVVTFVLAVSFRSFRSFPWFRFDGFVLAFWVLVHAFGIHVLYDWPVFLGSQTHETCEKFYHPNCILFKYSFSPVACQYLIKYFSTRVGKVLFCKVAIKMQIGNLFVWQNITGQREKIKSDIIIILRNVSFFVDFICRRRFLRGSTFGIVCLLQYNISIKSDYQLKSIDPHSDSLHNGVVKPKK